MVAKKVNCLATPHAADTMDKSDGAHHAKDRTNLPSPTETPVGQPLQLSTGAGQTNQATSGGTQREDHLCLAHKEMFRDEPGCRTRGYGWRR